MDSSVIYGLVTYAFVTSFTPGPNNLILISSGLNFGLKRTLPLMLGMVFGFGFMILVVGVGVFQVIETIPFSQNALFVASIIYMAYLAWRIANTRFITNKETDVPLAL